MRRLAARLRLPALLLATLALWLAPRIHGPAASPPPGRADDVAVAEPAKKKTPRPAPPSVAHTGSHAPSGSADASVFLLSEGGRAPRAYAVALDELYFPARPARSRVASIPAQTDLPALLAHAGSLASSGPADAAPRLVLYPVGAPRDAGTRRIVNPRIEVALASAAAPSPAPRPDLGIVAWERPSYAPDRAIARIVGDAAQPLRAAAAAALLPGIRSARPLLARQHFPRLVPNDPLFKDQWHLRNTRQQGGASGVDIRAVPAWDTTTGADIVVAVVDDGVDLSHPDLAPALNNSLGHDWNGNDSNPSAEGGIEDGDDHGTAVSGLAVARGNNGVGVSGVAPSATLAALRLIAAPSDDSEDAAAMAWREDVIDIKNNSWGPPDSEPDLHPAGDLWLAAVNSGVNSGRDGLGTLFFWAAGNGQNDRDQGSLDGYATARPVIAIAAINNKGLPAGFSEGGPHLVAAAAGDASAGVVTTDRAGDLGYNTVEYGYPGEYATNLDYTKTFGGTSAATPVAAGVGALLLAVRPDLGWRDVKEILLRSSTKLQATSPDWITRHAGDTARPIKHHPRLGGGHVNALDALALAKNWVPLGLEETITAIPLVDSQNPSGPWPIPDKTSANPTHSIPVDIPSDLTPLRVEHAVVTLNIAHEYRSDLEIALVAPSGAIARFTQGGSALVGEDFADYPFTSVRHWGENSHIPSAPSLRWVLKIRDAVSEDVGMLQSATLTLYGTRLEIPAKVADPASQALATGSTLVLRAAFSGGNLSYEWRRNGQLIPGANAAECRLPDFTAKTAGTYVCKASNILGIAYATATATLDDTPRDTLEIRAGTTTSIDLGSYVDGDIVLWKTTALPAGLRLDPVTGLLTGRPTKPADGSAIVTATAADGTITRIPLSFSIAPLAPALVGTFSTVLDEEGHQGGVYNGSVSVTTSANGRVTGLLKLGVASYSFSGLLDGDEPEHATLFDVPVARGTLLLDVGIHANGTIGASVTTTAAPDTPLALGEGRIHPWNARTLPATAYAGAWSLALVPQAGGVYGLGANVVTLTVSPAGAVAWNLSPSDGSPALRGSCLLGDDGTAAFHAPYAKNLGSFLIRVPLPAAPAEAITSLSLGNWQRAESATLAAPSGFIPLDLALISGGGRHAKPASGVRILGRSSDTDPLHAFVADDLAALSSASPLSTGVTVTAANALKVAAPNPPKLALSFAAATGRISGTHVLGDPARTARVTAVVLPRASPPAAVGFSFAPAASGSAPHSKVFLLAPPAE